MKKFLKAVAIISTVIVLGVVLFSAFVFYGNWSAERRAREFCDAIPIGSSISTAIARAEKHKVVWVLGRFYTFIFPAAFFDKAVCEVEVDQRGTVVKKGAVMEHD